MSRLNNKIYVVKKQCNITRINIFEKLVYLNFFYTSLQCRKIRKKILYKQVSETAQKAHFEVGVMRYEKMDLFFGETPHPIHFLKGVMRAKKWCAHKDLNLGPND